LGFHPVAVVGKTEHG